MNTLPKWRIVLMRVLYAITFLSLAFDNWFLILFPSGEIDVLSGVSISFWASYSILMGLGIRYPIKMIPLLLLQLLYKAAWIMGTYRPAYLANSLNEDLQDFFWICIIAIVLDIVVIPWRLVYFQYLQDFLRFRKKPEF